MPPDTAKPVRSLMGVPATSNYDKVKNAARTRTETSTAMPGMATQAAELGQIAATGNIGAPYVVPNPIMLNSVPAYEFLPVVTPLNPDAFEHALRSLCLYDKYYDIPHSLRFGFDMGVHSILRKTFTPNNHASALSHPEAISMYIKKELSARRYTGPFSQSRLEHIIGPFRSSPLGVVPKAGTTDEFRLVQDFSFPRNDPHHDSVNSEIDLDAFSCDWGTFSEVVLLVIDAPPGTEGATLDVDAAFRCCPIAPSQQRHFIVGWQGQFYIDHNTPFGASSSSGVWGHLADALAAIFAARNIGPLKKWVDDFLFLRYPTEPSANVLSFSYDLSTLYAATEEFGWPWKHSKTRPFTTSFTYLGFLWDLPAKTVEITPIKKTRYLEKLTTWRSKHNVSRKEAESMLGTLSHCTFALPDGRSRLPALSRFTASFSHATSEFSRRTPNSSVLADIEWWSIALSQPFCGSRLVRPPSMSPIEIWVDASSTWGIGVVFDGFWDTWRLTDGWKTDGRDIGWAEMIAIELGLRTAIRNGHSSIHFRFHSDNLGVIGALDAGKSRNSQQNRVLQRIVALMRTHSIWIATHYVPSAQNLADGPS